MQVESINTQVYFRQGKNKITSNDGEIIISGPKTFFYVNFFPQLDNPNCKEACREAMGKLDVKIEPIDKGGDHERVYIGENVRKVANELFSTKRLNDEEYRQLCRLLKQHDLHLNYIAKCVNKCSQPINELICELLIDPQLESIMEEFIVTNELFRFTLSTILSEGLGRTIAVPGNNGYVIASQVNHYSFLLEKREYIENVEHLRKIAQGTAGLETTFEKITKEPPPSLKAIRKLIVTRALEFLDKRFPLRQNVTKFLTALELYAYVECPDYAPPGNGRDFIRIISKERPMWRPRPFDGNRWSNFLLPIIMKYAETKEDRNKLRDDLIEEKLPELANDVTGAF